MNGKYRIVQASSWLMGVAVLALAIIVWAQQRLGSAGLTVYDYFPLLGLTAFSLMWTHYMIGSIRRLTEVDKKVNHLYMKVTSYVVLLLIVLHPALLIMQLKFDGFGFPPGSYAARYGGEGMKFAIVLGMFSLFIFLAFELKKKLKGKKIWKVIEYGQILAMFLIVYHGLTLGRELSVDWYKSVWYVYALLLVASIGYNFVFDRKKKAIK